MHPYPGQDATGFTPGIYVPNKGYWITPNVADDGNDRDAANAMIAVEGALDRTVWIAWRFVNGMQGGTYPGAITWNGSQVFNGGVTFAAGGAFVCNRAQPEFTSGLHVTAGQTNLDGAVDIDGSLTAHGGAAFPAGSVVQLGDVIVHAGTAAYRELRKATGPSVDATVNLWEADLWIAPLIGTDKTWTLAHPPGNAVVEAFVDMPSAGAGHLTLSDGGSILSIGTAVARTAHLIYNGSLWRVAGSST